MKSASQTEIERKEHTWDSQWHVFRSHPPQNKNAKLQKFLEVYIAK